MLPSANQSKWSLIALWILAVTIAAFAAEDALSNSQTRTGLTQQLQSGETEAIFTKDCSALSAGQDECGSMRASMISAFVFALNALILNVAQILNINAEAVLDPRIRTREVCCLSSL